jgi:hypothetical protein
MTDFSDEQRDQQYFDRIESLYYPLLDAAKMLLKIIDSGVADIHPQLVAVITLQDAVDAGNEE